MPATPRVARARPATPHRATQTLLLALMCPAAALAQPAQRPMLSSTVGATPNLMITLDNSASMTKPFADDYIVGAERRANDGTWAAQRSAEINPLYYNPRITYLPRVDAGGNPLVPTDGVVFISNQTGAPFDYKVYSSASVATADAPVVVHHSTFEVLATFEPEPGRYCREVQETRQQGVRVDVAAVVCHRADGAWQVEFAAQQRQPDGLFQTASDAVHAAVDRHVQAFAQPEPLSDEAEAHLIRRGWTPP